MTMQTDPATGQRYIQIACGRITLDADGIIRPHYSLPHLAPLTGYWQKFFTWDMDRWLRHGK